VEECASFLAAYEVTLSAGSYVVLHERFLLAVPETFSE
jgi:hypothetical protein